MGKYLSSLIVFCCLYLPLGSVMTFGLASIGLIEFNVGLCVGSAVILYLVALLWIQGAPR
jgi:hypothetical protein